MLRRFWQGMMKFHRSYAHIEFLLLSLATTSEGAYFLWKHNPVGFLLLPFGFFAWGITVLILCVPKTEANPRSRT